MRDVAPLQPDHGPVGSGTVTALSPSQQAGRERIVSRFGQTWQLLRGSIDAIADEGEQTGNTTLRSIDGRRHLHDLNPAQRSAVEDGIGGDTQSPPALLIAAGAGTGKTKTLAHRVAHLILNGADPHRLLLLTFTRRAALEMTRRAHQILAEARGDGAGRSSTQTAILPWSGTFHSVGSRLLRLHAPAIGLDPSFTVLDRADSADLLDFVRSELGLARTASRFPRKGTCLAY